MRKRFGAIHSDTTEEYVETAILAQDRQLLYYDGHSTKQVQKVPDFDFADHETNDSVTSTDQYTIENKSVMVIDNGGILKEVQMFCGMPNQCDTNYQLEYCSKSIINEQEMTEVNYQFWITNDYNAKYQEIVNVYIKNCQEYIYFYTPNNEDQFQMFLNKVRSYKSQYTIYQVTLSNCSIRSQSSQQLQLLDNNIRHLHYRTPQEALIGIVNK